MEPQRLVVGIVIKPHGIRGEVAVQVVSEAPGRFDPGAVLHAGDRTLTVATSRPHQGRLLVTFEEVTDRNAAEELRRVRLEIDTADAAPLGEGAYYPHQLEGLDVVDEAGTPLGTLVRVEDNPAHDHWVVDTGDGEVMVPAVRQIVVGVDLDARRVTVSPPEGLF